MKASLTRIIGGTIINIVVAAVLLQLLGFGFMVAAMLIWTVMWVKHWSKYYDENEHVLSEEELTSSFLYACVYGGLLTWIACLFICFIPTAYTKQAKLSTIKTGWNMLAIGVKFISSSTTKLLDIVLSNCSPKYKDQE